MLPVVEELLYHFPIETEHAHAESSLRSEDESNAAIITNASGFSSELTHRDHLQFYLYSAMIYMAIKKWDRACHCLNVVITSSTASLVSKIMIEAYKKWILANLLGHGKVVLNYSAACGHLLTLIFLSASPHSSLDRSTCDKGVSVVIETIHFAGGNIC